MKAFPNTSHRELEKGMDLRDYFAAKATEPDIDFYLWKTTINTGYVVAKHQVMTREQAKYAYADAMMEARIQK